MLDISIKCEKKINFLLVNVLYFNELFKLGIDGLHGPNKCQPGLAWKLGNHGVSNLGDPHRFVVVLNEHILHIGIYTHIGLIEDYSDCIALFSALNLSNRRTKQNILNFPECTVQQEF